MDDPELDTRLRDAEAMIVAGEFAAARALLTETTGTHPESARAWKELGVVEEKRAEHEVAERHLLRSLQLDDADGDAWSVLGGLYFYDLARPDDAARCFRRSLDIDPANTYALMNYLTVTAASDVVEPTAGQYAQALADGERRCTTQIEQDTNVPWCYYDLGQILFFAGRYAECRSSIRKGIARSSDWQARSARQPYEQLSRAPRFAAPARAVLGEFPSAERIG